MPTQDNIRDLKAGKQVRDAVYLLAEKQVRTAKNGRLFLSARLRDSTGEIEARFWDLPPGVGDDLEAGQGARVSGEVTSFQGRAQLRLDRIEPQPIRARDFFPTSSQPLEAMRLRLEQHVRGIRDPWLRRLLDRVLLAPDFLPRFIEAPAAREYHHACLGGLVEHTLGVTGLAEVVASLYPDVPRDLVLALALLHDIGKVEAYDWDADFRRSDEGRLLDHIYLGTRRVEMAIAEWPHFPAELRRRILHAILAHHGQAASGSPVRPQTLEAIVLHLCDKLDADIRGFQDHVERHALPGEAWTEWSKMFEAQLYRGPQQPAADGGSPSQPGLPWDEVGGEREGDLPF